MRRGTTVFRATVAALTIGGLLLVSGCYGPFNLTRTIHQWNGKIQGVQDIPAKWMQEAVFVALVLIPVYPFSVVVDALVFNSIQFWTGENPIKVSRGSDGRPPVVTAGDITIIMAAPDPDGRVQATYVREGQVFARGTLLSEGERFSLRDDRDRPLASAEVAPSGGVNLVDGDCRLIGTIPADLVSQVADRLAQTGSAGPG